jgi:ABC-type nickel/cobalt efflux system permease component RcnA
MTQALVKRSPVETFSIIIAAGIRPCMGAIVVLVFALSQNLFIVGVIATFAMAFGTALTTSLLAALAVFAKSLALNLAEKRTSKLFTVVMRSAELLAAAFIVVLGLSLFWQR